MKSNYAQQIKRVVSALKLSKPKKIIVFGSVSHGAIHAESDIDICVITPTNDLLSTKRKLRDLMWNHDIRFDPEIDLHIYPPHTYQDYLARHDPFVEEIEKGKVYYEA